MSESKVDGWCILEVMGHRRIAGFVREVTVAGAGFLRIDVPSGCEGGVSAGWCPEHGKCACPKPEEERADPKCPLHAPTSAHPVEWSATQFYPPASVYCLTPSTEEVVRASVRRARPVEFSRLSLPGAAASRSLEGEDGFDEASPDYQPGEEPFTC